MAGALGISRQPPHGWAGQEPLEHAPRPPDRPVILADLDPELHRLPLGIPAGVLGVAKPPLRPVRQSRSHRLAAILAADLSKGRGAKLRGSGAQQPKWLAANVNFEFIDFPT